MTNVAVLPANDATNGWNRILPPRTPQPPLNGEQRADWAVVGAGYAGLAAARRLAENRPQDRIVLLEAGSIPRPCARRSARLTTTRPSIRPAACS